MEEEQNEEEAEEYSTWLFWEMTALLGSTVDTCMALYVLTLLRPLVPGSYLFGVGLPEEYLC